MTGLLGWLAQHFGQGAELPSGQKQHLMAWHELPQANLSQSLDHSRCVVLDVESSGLNLREDRLISIGAVAVVNGRIALGDSYSVVLQQEKVSGRENILLHGIGGSAQAEGAPPADGLLSFLSYLGKDPLVAFHAVFDSIMIRRAIKQYLGFDFNLKTAVDRIIGEPKRWWRGSDSGNNPLDMLAYEAPDCHRVQLLRSTFYPALKQGRDSH